MTLIKTGFSAQKGEKNILGDSVETRCKISRIDKVLSLPKQQEVGNTSLIQRNKWRHSPGVSGVVFWFSLPVLPSSGPPSLESPGQETGGSSWTNSSHSLLKRPPLFPSCASQGVTGCASSRTRASPCVWVSNHPPPPFPNRICTHLTLFQHFSVLFASPFCTFVVFFYWISLADELLINSHSITWFFSCWRLSLRLDRPLSHCAIRNNKGDPYT